MRCEDCGEPIAAGVPDCPACGAAVDAALVVLGRFDPAVVPAVAELARRRRVPTTEVADAAAVSMLVPAPDRDDLRAELVVAWPGLVAELGEDEREALPTAGDLPGWLDAPQAVWVDRVGRLRVGAAPGEEEAEDASRAVGPALVAAAIVLLLLAWYVGDGHLRLFAGLGGAVLLLVGTFLPR